MPTATEKIIIAFGTTTFFIGICTLWLLQSYILVLTFDSRNSVKHDKTILLS